VHQIWVHPLQNGRFLLPTNLGRERLHADELSEGTNNDDLERPWTPEIKVFSELFAISGCDAYLKSEFSPKLLEIDQDNLRTKLS